MNRLGQEAPQLFKGRMYQRDSSKPKEKRILVLKTGIAGLKQNIESDEEQEALNAIKPGDELILYREPNNEYDKWAVAVHLTDEDKLGFITRFKNETIARLMDVGKKFIGVVDDPATDEEAAEIVEKENKRNSYKHNAPTENMALPFSVYMIED